MRYDNALIDPDPGMLAQHLLAGCDVVYFTMEDRPDKLTTMAAKASCEIDTHRPVSEARAEAMRLHRAGLCELVQRRSWRATDGKAMIRVDYIAATRRRPTLAAPA